MLIALCIELSIKHGWQQSKALLVYFGLASGRVRYNEVGEHKPFSCARALSYSHVQPPMICRTATTNG